MLGGYPLEQNPGLFSAYSDSERRQMMADILNIPSLGRLEIIETYAYYDQPVLFSCKNAAGYSCIGARQTGGGFRKGHRRA